MAAERPGFWIDCLGRKHEFWRYEPAHTVKVNHEGQEYLIRLHHESSLIIKATARSGNLLFVVAEEQADEDRDECANVLIVANHLSDNVFAVVVWHELFSEAFNLMGLGATRSSGGING
jgi:hypothetical protein